MGWYKCMFENFEFKTYHKERIKKHEIHKQSKEPKKMYTCDGCGWKTSLKSRMMKHSRSCIQFIGRKQRVVKNSDNNCQEICKEFEGIFKRNCINAYICQTNVIDSRGQEVLTAAVIVKEGGDPEVAKADQPEVRDLVQQVAREE